MGLTASVSMGETALQSGNRMRNSSLTEQVAALVRTPSFDDITLRGGGIQPSDLIRQLGVPLVLARCLIADPRGLDATAPLSEADAVMVQDVIAAALPDLLAGAALAAVVVRDVVGRTPALRPATVGEKALIRVRTYLAVEGSLPEAPWADQVVKELAVDADPYLDSTAFVAAHAATWSAAWHERGAAALKSYPPSSIGLGRDVAPPLLPDGNGRTWLDGTDRCVYDRYALAWRGRSHRAEPRVATLGHLPATLRPAPDPYLCAAEELDRASSGYGLASPHHRAVLEALSGGASTALQGKTGPAVRQYRASCQTGSDSLLHFSEAVAEYLTRWTKGGAASDLELVHGSLDNHADKIGAAVVRKVWMDLHRREREAAEDACSCLMFRYARTAVEKAVPEALAHWPGPDTAAPKATDDQWRGSKPEQADAQSRRDDADAQIHRDNATFQLLLDNPTVAASVFQLAPGWEDLYLALIVSDPATYMTVEQLRAYIVERPEEDRP